MELLAAVHTNGGDATCVLLNQSSQGGWAAVVVMLLEFIT